jgi:cytochrome c553
MGQKGTQLLDTMKAFMAGDRANDHYGRMRYIASKLSDQEIEQTSAFYSAPAAAPKKKDE